VHGFREEGPEPTHDFRLVGGGDGDFFSCKGLDVTTTFELTTGLPD